MNFDYDIFPKVFSLSSEATISICGEHEDKRFEQGEIYDLNIFSKVDHSDRTDLEVKADNQGFLRLYVKFSTKGEYSIHILRKDEENRLLSEEHVFVLEPEMMEL